MSKYNWNSREINQKMKYVKERLSNATDLYEKKKLLWSLLTYHELFQMIGNVRYTGIYNVLDKITNGKYSLQREQKLSGYMGEFDFTNIDLVDENYLQFLLKISENIAPIHIQKDKLPDSNLTEQQIVELINNYFKSLDEELSVKADKILDPNKQHINFATIVRTGTEIIYGKNYTDPIFNDSYCSILKTNTLSDPMNLAHEVMHGVDNMHKSWLPFEEYNGFVEIPTMTNDMLMIDCLETLGFNADEITTLRTENIETPKVVAFHGLFTIKRRLKQTKNKVYDEANITDIKDGLTQEEITELLFVQSYVVAYGLAKQIRENKELGLSNLKLLMSTRLPKDKIPDFSFIGLDNSKLLELSQELNQNYSFKEDHSIKR